MKPNAHPLRCRCGRIEGEVANPRRGIRGVCYCRDCQAFAHFLELPDGMLDALGGTDVVVVRPCDVRFTAGLEHLACMSLSPKGTLRWYAGCCGTPIGNTPRDIRLAHLGLVHSALEAPGSALDDAFGPVRMRVNTKSARAAPPAARVLATVWGGLRYARGMLWSRVSGSYRNHPLFDASGQPRAPPRVLSLAEREALNDAVARNASPTARRSADR